MRHARLLSAAILSLIVVAACTSASAGWTYVPGAVGDPGTEFGGIGRARRVGAIAQPR